MKHRVKTLTLLPLLTVALLVIGLMAPLSASTASRASSKHVSVPTQHSLSLPAFIKGTTTKSLNWSGYAASGSSGKFTKVSAKWTEPAVKCSSTATYSSFWVGLDGFNSSTVEQTGTLAFCQSGSPGYVAWYEMYPGPEINISDPVKPGDAMSASVTAVTSSSFTLVISDSTRGWTFKTTKTLSGAARSSAEVIAEAPSSSSGILPLANFGTVHFSSSMVNGKTLGSFKPQEIVMVTSSGTVKAQPSALSNGTAFSVTWKHS